MNKKIKNTTIIAIIILLVSACGFRQHEKKEMRIFHAQQAINEIINQNMPICNPDFVNCESTTGAH